MLGSSDRVQDYLRAIMGHLPVEQIRVLFLTSANRLIADEVFCRGTVDAATLCSREILRAGLEFGAAGFILVHNHPSGDPAPSESDISATRRLARTASELDISLLDHIIVARSGTSSFRALGLI